MPSNIPYSQYKRTKARVRALVVASHVEHSPQARTSRLSLVTADGLQAKATVTWPAHLEFANQESPVVTGNLEDLALAQLTTAQLQREGYGQEICIDMTA